MSSLKPDEAQVDGTLKQQAIRHRISASRPAPSPNEFLKAGAL